MVTGGLLAAVLAAIVGIQILARPEASVEASVRRYAVAISSADLDAALTEIAPDQRERWTNFVRTQLGNIYDVRGIAVRSPSALERMTQRVAAGPFEVTAVLEINRDFPDEFYAPTTRVPVTNLGGRVYLQRPLLAPP
jgi:hypothetical protein